MRRFPLVPQPQRVDVWRRLATDLRPAHLSTTAKVVSFEGCRARSKRCSQAARGAVTSCD
jgi:hypothetical protein